MLRLRRVVMSGALSSQAGFIGLAHLLQSHNDEAIIWFGKAFIAIRG
jgi:hypothetical protein